MSNSALHNKILREAAQERRDAERAGLRWYAPRGAFVRYPSSLPSRAVDRVSNVPPRP